MLSRWFLWKPISALLWDLYCHSFAFGLVPSIRTLIGHSVYDRYSSSLTRFPPWSREHAANSFALYAFSVRRSKVVNKFGRNSRQHPNSTERRPCEMDTILCRRYRRPQEGRILREKIRYFARMPLQLCAPGQLTLGVGDGTGFWCRCR